MSVTISVDDGKVLISVPKRYASHPEIVEAVRDAEQEIADAMVEASVTISEGDTPPIERIQELFDDLIATDEYIEEEDDIVERIVGLIMRQAIAD